MVSELQTDLIIERSTSKVENMSPAWEDEMPLDETLGAEIFFDHARVQIDRIRQAYQLVGRKAQGVGDSLFCTISECAAYSKLDLQEAVRLSAKAENISESEALRRSGHLSALEELSQGMLQKVVTSPELH